MVVSNFSLEATCCTCDFFELMDGTDDSAVQYGHWYNDDTPPSFISRSNNVYVRFRSDSLFTSSGFHLDYVIGINIHLSNYV